MRRLKVIAAICGLGLGFAAAAPAAHAFNLIPEQEGEVELTNIDALEPGDAIDLGFNVTSLDYGQGNGLSRLFVDSKGTANDYGNGFITFGATDGGTTEGLGQYWLRSVAIDSDGNPVENGGNLEVGRFKFDFGNEVVDEITLDFFDTEALGTGILEVNGQAVENFLTAGEDGNTQQLTLNNVSSFVIQLGNATANDGVTLSGIESSKDFVKSVPEPTTTFSLGALAVAGMFGVKKRKKFKK